MGMPTLSLGCGADADLYMGRFSFEGNFHVTYWDGKKSIMKGTNESLNKLKNYSSFRLGGRFHLMDKAGTHKMKANVSTEYITGGTITHYIPMKVPCRSIIALHFGLEHYNTVVKSKRDAIITAKDGTKLSEWQSGTNLKVTMLYGGFSFVKIMKTKMTSGGDTWNFNWYRHIYIDALFAPLMNVQNIMTGTQSYVVQGTGTTGFEKSAIGARFGMNMVSKGKMSVRYEIGILPGLAGRGFFTQASFGIPIVKHIKLK